MLKVTLETLDGIDDALKSFYTEDDGKFYLQVDGVDDHPDVAALKNAYQQTKSKLNDAKIKIVDLESASKLPEDFTVEKWEKLKSGKPDEAALVKLREDMEGKIADLEKQLETERGNSLKSALDRDLTDILAAAGVTNATFQKAARTMIAPQVKMDESGKPTVDTDMGPQPLGDYVKRFLAKDGKDFVTPPSGGGAPGGKGGGAQKFSELSPAAKVKLNREDPTEYQRLKAADTT